MYRLEKMLREKKLRITQAREEIFLFLTKQTIALSPREIFKKLAANSNADLASVYRNLNLFEELGIVHKVQGGKYALCSQDQTEGRHKHIHILNHCVLCGSSKELADHSDSICDLAKKIKKISVTLKKVQTIVIHGKCNSCESH